MTKLEQILKTKALQSGDMDFQGFKLQAFFKGQKVMNLAVGKTYPYYDLASLTKILFTTPWFMAAFEDDGQILDRKVKDLLPWYQHSSVRVGQLLNHSAGNQWWEPFYNKLSLHLPPEQAYQQMENLCRWAPLTPAKKTVYSDIDFYLLGSIMQKIEDRPLLHIWKSLREEFYPQSQLHFNRKNQPVHPVNQYAPTEKCSWRKKVLRGQVHDENCWALGGMAPHAGLFGRIDDLSLYGQFLREVSLGKNKNLKAKTLLKFRNRSLPSSRGDWGYGFMLPSAKGSSAGDRMSRMTFGHTGFTGTSFWMDPEKDLFVSLVSNRVHPTRNNKGFVRLRPKLHNWIVELLEGEL